MTKEQKILILNLKKKYVQLRIKREKHKEKPSLNKLKELKKQHRDIYKKLYYLQNDEIFKTQAELWRQENPQKAKENIRRFQKTDKYKSYQKRYQEQYTKENREKLNAYYRELYKKTKRR